MLALERRNLILEKITGRKASGGQRAEPAL